jgi:mRNA-degrading endonuclease YafQ of YafQ-DinJ toxin-antitoxin module
VPPADFFSSFERTKRFEKAYRALTKAQREQVEKAIVLLVQNPAHPGLATHPVQPGKYFWEAYINRHDRMIYVPEGSHLVLVDIVKHDDIDKYAKAP